MNEVFAEMKITSFIPKLNTKFHVILLTFSLEFQLS